MSKSKKGTNDFLKQGTLLAAASIIVRMIGLIYRIPMANTLGEEGNGIYSIAYNIYSLALIISSYSLPLAVSKMVAARVAQKEYKNAYRYFMAALKFATVSGLIVGGVVFAGAEGLANLFETPGAKYPLQILAPTIFVVALLGVFRGFFQGNSTMVPTALSQIFEQIINAVVSVVAAYGFMKAHSASKNISAYGAAGGTLGTLTGAMTALLFLVGIYFLYKPVYRRKIKRDKTKNISNRALYEGLIMTIMPVILSQTIYQCSSTLDTMLFGKIMKYKGMEETVRSSMIGVYGSQYTVLLSVPLGIATSMGTSMIPSVVSSYTLGNYGEVKKKVKSVIKFNMLIAFPSAAGLTVLSEPVIRLLFPSLVTYRGVAAKLLLFGSVALVFSALSTVTSGVLQGINRMKLPMIHSAISLGIHIVIVAVLLAVTDMGVYALIIGNITFPLVVCILNARSVKKYLKYNQEVKTTFLIPLLSSVIMGAAVFAVYQILELLLHRNMISVVVSVIVGIVVYFVSILILKGVQEEELKEMPMGRTMASVAEKMHLL